MKCANCERVLSQSEADSGEEIVCNRLMVNSFPLTLCEACAASWPLLPEAEEQVA